MINARHQAKANVDSKAGAEPLERASTTYHDMLNRVAKDRLTMRAEPMSDANELRRALLCADQGRQALAEAPVVREGGDAPSLLLDAGRGGLRLADGYEAYCRALVGRRIQVGG